MPTRCAQIDESTAADGASTRYVTDYEAVENSGGNGSLEDELYICLHAWSQRLVAEPRREGVALSRKDEVTFSQAVDLVRPDVDPHGAPSQTDVGVVPLFFRHRADPIDERGDLTVGETAEPAYVREQQRHDPRIECGLRRSIDFVPGSSRRRSARRSRPPDGSFRPCRRSISWRSRP